MTDHSSTIVALDTALVASQFQPPATENGNVIFRNNERLIQGPGRQAPARGEDRLPRQVMGAITILGTDVSEVFKSEHGYHFLEVTGRRVEDFSERFKMGQAENYLRNQKFDEELENWIREIREEAFVEIKI